VVQQKKEDEQLGKRTVTVKRPRARVFSVGDLVWRYREPVSKNERTAKLMHFWLGPYTVVGKTGEHTYRLEVVADAARGEQKFDKVVEHADRLKRYTPPAPEEPVVATASPSELRPYLGPRWTAEHNNECERCGTGGELVICDWCNVVYHAACLPGALANHEQLEEWACPECKNAAWVMREAVLGYTEDKRTAVEKFFNLTPKVVLPTVDSLERGRSTWT
jgi:hypothetical protein